MPGGSVGWPKYVGVSVLCALGRLACAHVERTAAGKVGPARGALGQVGADDGAKLYMRPRRIVQWHFGFIPRNRTAIGGARGVSPKRLLGGLR
jgi:hypothetical protein